MILEYNAVLSRLILHFYKHSYIAFVNGLHLT